MPSWNRPPPYYMVELCWGLPLASAVQCAIKSITELGGRWVRGCKGIGPGLGDGKGVAAPAALYFKAVLR